MWTYEAALDYLYSFINYEVRREVRYAPEVMSLDRPRRLLELLGNPHEAYPIIHITGTKGKGSVGAYCQAALQAAGLRAGLYSSPHLQDFRERFRVNGRLIEKTMMAELLAEVKPVLDSMPDLTWFEITTALGLLYFQRMKAEAVVLEVGLGGRLDATNVVTPLVSVITSLSYDHTHLLGNTLAEIAREKAGIIKSGVPVVSAPQPEEAALVLAEVAAGRAAPLHVVGRDWVFEPGVSTLQGQVVHAGRPDQLETYWTPLAGRHQAVNTTVALAALSIAREAGLNLPPEIVANHRFEADWPGRFEVVSTAPVIVLDAAHNQASAACLRDTLAEVFPAAAPRVLIFGASADKDVAGMFTTLLPEVEHLIVVQAVHPRALDTGLLAEQAVQSGYAGAISKVPVMADALTHARKMVGETGAIVITGSLFVIGEARDVLGLPSGHAAYVDSVADETPRLT